MTSTDSQTVDDAASFAALFHERTLTVGTRLLADDHQGKVAVLQRAIRSRTDKLLHFVGLSAADDHQLNRPRMLGEVVD